MEETSENDEPVLRFVHGGPNEDEMAAVTAVLTALAAQRRETPSVPQPRAWAASARPAAWDRSTGWHAWLR